MRYKNIWMCWFQGLNHPKIPTLNKLCMNKWIELNKNSWDINILSLDNIKEYVPEFFDITANRKMSFTKQSDLLRILLLEKYGGVWVDASVYPMLPLSDFVNSLINDTNFFGYRFFPRSICKKNGNREISSWFLIANEQQHYLIKKWKNSFVNKIFQKKYAKYYCFHETLTEIMDTDTKIKDIINNMVQINQKIPHSAMGNWNKKLDSFVYKRPKLILG